MKSTPQELKIYKNLQAGEMSINGFLGKDHRHFLQIIAEDRARLEELDVTTDLLADRMIYFTEKAFEHYEGPMVIDEKYEVYYESFRGKMVCPFAHPGVFRKGSISLKNLENGLEVIWTPLNIHMIRDHCFFEGRGSAHRLEPAVLQKVLF